MAEEVLNLQLVSVAVTGVLLVGKIVNSFKL